MLLSIRNTDSIGAAGSEAGYYTHLAYLKIQTDSIKPATTRYLRPVMIIPLNPDYGVGLKWAAVDNSAYAHPNWSYWSTSDTAWNVAGADSCGEDWTNAFFDSFAVVQNGTYTVNITPWMEFMDDMNLSDRRGFNGLMFVLAQEDSASDAWVKLGNVQPFANVDSTWIELYRIWSEGESGLEAGEKWFGNDSVTTAITTIDNQIAGGRYRTTWGNDAGNGTLDYMTAWIGWSGTVSGTVKIRGAAYKIVGLVNGTRIDTTNELSLNCAGGQCTAGNRTLTFVGKASIASTDTLLICVWSNGITGTPYPGVGYRSSQVGYARMNVAVTYGVWPATQGFTASNSVKTHVVAWYDVPTAGGASSRKRRMQTMGGQ